MTRAMTPPAGNRRLDGQVALVTGAAPGPKAALGASFAKAMAAAGASVMLCDIKECDELAESLRKEGATARAFTVDVSDETAVGQMFAEIDRTCGRLDILVNNAAIGSNIPPIGIDEISVDAWDRFMAVNVRGTFLCSRTAAPLMRRNNYGKIINISSTTIRSGLAHRLHYVATKGAIAAMTRSMAKELGDYGIRVNSLAPGLIMNDSVASTMAGRPGMEGYVLKSRAIKQHVYDDELIGTLLFLSSRDSDAVTGQFLVVDNGGDFT